MLQPKDRLAEWIKKEKIPLYMLSTRDPLHLGTIETDSEGKEKDIP